MALTGVVKSKCLALDLDGSPCAQDAEWFVQALKGEQSKVCAWHLAATIRLLWNESPRLLVMVEAVEYK